jgi:tRNA-2-methylthio-N6-dimethylallyladenosine synthase
MNRLDADLVRRLLAADGARLVDDAEAADVILFLTCSVRAHAENRVFSNIGALAARKRCRPDLVVGLLGCMAQQHGERIRERAPLLDVVCAPGRLAELPELIAAARSGEPAVALDPPRRSAGPGAFGGADAALDRVEVRRLTGGGLPGQAFVRVMRGCDNFCSYCVVPNVRGPERSRPPEAVLEEVRRLAGQGVLQVTLLGQAVDKYAYRDGGRTWRLADLLVQVAAVPGLERVHFITNHPRAMTPDLAAAFRDLSKVCPYLHMPAQAGSDAVLARMNRGYTAAEYLERVAMVREGRPETAVHSDFIVGFPGETPEDFEATLGLVRQARFAGAFVFKYSPRPGTRAAERFADDVPPEEKKRRNAELLELVGRIVLEENRRLLGREVELFVEGPSPRPHLDGRTGAATPGGTECAETSPESRIVQLRGRTRCNRIVVFDGPSDFAGRLVTARINRAEGLTLFATTSQRETGKA